MTLAPDVRYYLFYILQLPTSIFQVLTLCLSLFTGGESGQGGAGNTTQVTIPKDVSTYVDNIILKFRLW